MTKATRRVGYLLVVAVLLAGLALASPTQSRAATPKGEQQTSSQIGSRVGPAQLIDSTAIFADRISVTVT